MIKIIAVGDIFLGDYTLSLGYGIRSSIKKKGYDFHLDHVKTELLNGDLIFGNLETVISDKNINTADIKSLICRGEEASVELLKKGGFNVLNVANNHILQHGSDAYDETVRILNQNGLDVVGNKSNNELSCQPAIKVIHGTRVGVLGYSFVRENFQKHDISYAFGDIGTVRKDIALLRKNVDHVIVSCHWGIEYIDRPSVNIQRYAREMVDSGASLILGHHPHVVQGIERYKKSLIFYSLGNFLFDFLWSRETRESFIADISILDEGIEYGITPVYINDDYQVVPMSQKRSAEFREYVESISAGLRASGMDITEDENSDYYLEAQRNFKRYQRLKTFYMMKNIYRTDKKFIRYVFGKLNH